MTEKRPIDANELMARFFRKECLMRGHNAAASAAYKDAQKTVTAAPTVSLRPEWRNPETDPPKVEEDVMILFETACGGYGITTAHYEDGTVNPDDVYNNRVDSPVVGWMPLPPKEVAKK